jgi:hypothetical protein
MPLKFYPPSIVEQSENPADAFLRKPEELILGVTYPMYYDKVIDDAECKIRSPLPISKVPPVGSPSPRTGPAKFPLTFIASPKHVFSWRIELPKNPTIHRWISTAAVDPAAIAKIVQGTNRVLNTPLDKLSAKHRLELVCLPSNVSYYNHVLNHEMQHVADFYWLANAIFGKWVSWRDELAKKADCGLVVNNLDTFKWILAGGDFGNGDPQDFLKAYLCATRDVGKLFHKTPKGARPTISFQGLINDPRFGPTAQFHISAQASMAQDGLNYDSPPHNKFTVPSIYEIVSENAEVEIGFARGPQGNILVSQSGIDRVESPAFAPSEDVCLFSIFD